LTARTRARSTQSNLRNALTAEQTNWTNSQNFTTDASAIEPVLTWTTDNTVLAQGDRHVYTYVNGQAVLIEGYAKDGNCYAIYQSNDPAADFTSYAAYKGACAAATAVYLPTAAATASGNGAVGSAAPAAAADWHTSW
jgi:hypothetical protein